MIRLDEDALICDLAETYHVFDYRSLPIKTAATLAAGLRDDSRIKLQAAGIPVRTETILLASIADRIEAFHRGFTKDKDMQSLVKILLSEDKKDTDTLRFNSGDELKKALARARGE